MKSSRILMMAMAAMSLHAPLFGQGAGSSFTNFIRQVQMPTQVERDMSVAATGEQLSPLAIDPGGARFELWTVRNTNPPTSYLLDSRYVGTYVPIAQVEIISEDPYPTIRRTRADRPFTVKVSMTGLLSDANAPEASQMVNLLHHVQSFGVKGDGTNIDRTQATLLGTRTLNQNGFMTEVHEYHRVPSSDLVKARGEERFSVFSLEDYQAPESQLASNFIQIWPVADAKINGLTEGQLVRFRMPAVTLTMNDLYPGSDTYTHVYKGGKAPGTVGVRIPGGGRPNTGNAPMDLVLNPSDYESIFNEGGDGQWTMEIITETPFGPSVLDSVSFMLNRTLNFNGSITSQE